ncbi:MAG: PDZ domain-containing protein, partial [Bacteroidales bacterium]|nr:PDZ domain-containing protein [Bacteroidales bacterium]
MKKIISTIIILGIIFTLSAQSSNFEISKNMEIYTSVYKSLFQNYVDDINSGELMRTGIDAMLKTLDPYTVYKSESEIEDFRYMTTGQYGGIGALIQQQGEYVVISEPYQGFPADKAGLIAGDKILKIDSKDMKGKSSSDISELMKGEPGSSFELTVERYGEKKPIVKKITREVVSIPSVAFYKVTDDSIGYIYFSSFTANSGAEFNNAYLDLNKEKELKGLIIDIRSNGGGLLNEAVNIMG